MIRRWCLTALVAVVGFVAVAWLVPPAGGNTRQAIQQTGRLVIVGVPELGWKQVHPHTTPALWSLVRRGAVGALTTRAYATHSCSPESWLTLSAGFAATNGHPPLHCPPAPTPQPAVGARGVTIPFWNAWRQRMLHVQPPAPIGMLADVLRAHGQCISAAGPDAALGAATSDGVVRDYEPTYDSLDLTTCPVSFISLEKYDDAALMVLLDRLTPRATVVVAGMADDGGPTTLHALVIAGPHVRHGVLTSVSTRQRGLVTTADLTALILDRVGDASPVLRIGRAPTVRPADTTDAVADVRDLTEALDVEHPFVPAFFGLFLGGSVLLLVIGTLRWWWISRPGAVYPRVHHRRVRAWFALVGAMCACMPVATFLVGLYPWWRSTHPRSVLCIGIVIASGALTALAFLGPWRRTRQGPMTFIVTVTFIVIAIDVVRGSGLQLVSVMGLQPVYGGRYYGMGNVGAAIWLTAGLMISTMIADNLVGRGYRRLATLAVLGIGTVTLTIDSAPWWGAKAGAMLAIVPAFSYLALRVANVRLTPRLIAAIVALTGITAAAFGLLDYVRPVHQRTHIGTTVADVLENGDLNGMTNIVRLNWEMLTSSWLNASVLLLVAAAVAVLVRPGLLAHPLGDVLEAYPLLGPGLVSIVVCWLLAFFSEDSGTGIPPTGLLVVVPLLTLLAARIPSHHRHRVIPGEVTTTAPPTGAAGAPISCVRDGTCLK